MAKAYAIDALRGAVSGYADHLCDAPYTVDNLSEQLENGPDQSELNRWGITTEEWIIAHKAAIEWLDSFEGDIYNVG